MLNTSSTKKKLFVATKSNLDIYSHEENGIFRYKYWSSMIALRHCFYFSITLAFCVYIDLWDIGVMDCIVNYLQANVPKWYLLLVAT